MASRGASDTAAKTAALTHSLVMNDPFMAVARGVIEALGCASGSGAPNL